MGKYFLVLALLFGGLEQEDYTNLGISMVEHGELPLAVYYFTKALEENPANHEAKERREKVWETLGIAPAPAPISPFSPYKVFWILLFFTAAAWIWTKNRWIEKILYVGLALLALLPLLFFLSQGLSPLTGVVIQSTLLYAEGRKDAPIVDLEPVRGGEIVRVTGITDDGEWLRVFTGDEKFGYISVNSTKI